MKNISEFEKVILTSKNLQEKFRASAVEASEYAEKISKDIEAAFLQANREFMDLMALRWQDYQFYAKLIDICDAKIEARHNAFDEVKRHDLNVAIYNRNVFLAIATDKNLEDFNLKNSKFVKGKDGVEYSVEEVLESTLVLAELVGTYTHTIHHYGHVVSATTGAINVILKRQEKIKKHKEAAAKNVFLEFSDALSELTKADEALRNIAIRIYRLPDSISKEFGKSASDPVSLEDATNEVLKALQQNRIDTSNQLTAFRS